MSMVSRAMRTRRSSGRYCRVRMLCRRSASLTRMTRMSSTMARSSLRKFSACRSSEVEKGILLILVTPSTMCSTSSPKYSLMRVGVGEGVLEHVVQEAHRHAGRVHAHLGQDGRHLEGMDEVGLAGGAGLALVLDRGEDVRLAQELEVGPRMVAPDGLVDVLEADHGARLPV